MRPVVPAVVEKALAQLTPAQRKTARRMARGYLEQHGSLYYEENPEALARVWEAAIGEAKSPIIVQSAAPTPDAPRAALARTGMLRPISGFESRDVSWLWPGRIPLGMLTLMEGDPKVGKSTLTLDIAARASRGDPMPEESAGIEPVHIVLVSDEDPTEEVTRPRLEAAGADLDRVHKFEIQEATDSEPRPLTICPEDVPLLEERVTGCGAKLVIVDPIVAYMPDGTDTNSDHQVRRVLRLLSPIAVRTGAAFVVIRHWRKSESGNALYRGGGSIGFAGAARSILSVGYDPEDAEKRRRVLAVAGSNVAPTAPSLSFRLAVEDGASLPRVHWQGISKHTASDLTQSQTVSAGRKADDLILELVTRDGTPSDDILAEAEDRDISEKTLRRRAHKKGISREAGTIYQREGGGPWFWRLPNPDGHVRLSDSNVHLRGNGEPPMSIWVPDVHPGPDAPEVGHD